MYSLLISFRWDHGGIGRRAALKMRSPQGGEGSIPSGPTDLTVFGFPLQLALAFSVCAQTTDMGRTRLEVGCC